LSGPIRVLVVDDAVVVRRVVGRALEAATGMELAGSARDGADALAKVESCRPDVIVLDLEMPVMDGFEVLRQLRDRGSDTPVVVFSHLSGPGAAAALDAVALGAVHFVHKPTTAEGFDLGEDYIARELLPLLRAIADERSAPPTPRAAAAPSPTAPGGAEAVAIAISTGGPTALAELIAGLEADFPAPILVVQHMPREFTKALADRLHRIGTLPVHEAIDGQAVRPGNVYIAPGGRHMTVGRTAGGVRVSLNDDPPENSCRPAGDVLFRSAAEAYGSKLLAVVMTGMGRDGQRGSETVRAAGGTVISQDLASSVVGGMPGAVAAISAASVPLSEMAAELVRRTAP
jgi:two-component system chemotaxis response regulator CheB